MESYVEFWTRIPVSAPSPAHQSHKSVDNNCGVCLAVPAKVVEIKGERAIVDFGGVRRDVSLALVDRDEVSVNSYVLVHTGWAIQVLHEEEAKKTLEIWREILAK